MGYNLGNAQRVKIQGYEAIIASINDIPKDINLAAELTIKETSEEFYKRVYKFISETRYTLAELREQDYPYAKRHGKIQVRGIDPKEKIHTRSGKMRSELSWAYTKIGYLHYGMIGWLTEYPEDYFSMVLYGTRKMLPRPALELVWLLQDLIEFIRDRIIYYHNRGNLPDKNRRTFEPLHTVKQIAKNEGF